MDKTPHKAKGSKKNRKIGRNEVKCKRYASGRTSEKNKLRRILKSSGIVEARKYAEEHGMGEYLSALMR
jgi:hypothetical protein